MSYYILDGTKAVPVAEVIEWAKWFESADRKVARYECGDVTVSTVFLGMDHNFLGGTPVLFETMVFGGPLDQEQDRYSTWDEAVAGHADMVTRSRSHDPPRSARTDGEVATMPNYPGRRPGTRRVTLYHRGKTQEWIVVGTKADGEGFLAKKRVQLGVTPRASQLRSAPELHEQVHRRFARFREHGEWFRPEQELRDYIDSLQPRTEAAE